MIIAGSAGAVAAVGVALSFVLRKSAAPTLVMLLVWILAGGLVLVAAPVFMLSALADGTYDPMRDDGAAADDAGTIADRCVNMLVCWFLGAAALLCVAVETGAVRFKSPARRGETPSRVP